MQCRNVFMNVLLIIIYGFIVNVSSQTDDGETFDNPGYLLSAPAIFRAGVDQTISIRLFNQNEAVRVNVKIMDSRDEMIASVSKDVIDSDTLTLQVPSGREGKAILHVCGNCHLQHRYNFRNSTPVTIVNKGRSAFIQTDKPIYKPSQTVNMAIFTVNRELRPVNTNITTYVLSPSDVRMAEWKNKEPACCGTTNIQFPLSDQPPLGTWSIVVEMDDNVFKATFEIREYVPPKFEVSISPAQYFRNISSCEEVSVDAKYTFGKPVTGDLYVNYTVEGVGYSMKDMGISAIRSKKLKINGHATFPICLNELIRPEDVDLHYRGALKLWATVTAEDGSEFTAFDDSAPISRHRIDIAFSPETRKHFKTGLPFHGQVLAKHLNGDSASNAIIRIKVEVNGQSYVTFDVEAQDGVAGFTVPALPHTTNTVWLDAKVIAVDGSEVGEEYLSTFRELVKWHSPSECHLLIESPHYHLTAGETVNFSIKSSCPCDFKLYYDILSRGDVVKSGTKIISEGKVGSENVCRQTLDITITPDMAPISKLLVYFIKENGEGVADGIQFPVKSTLENAVSVTMSEDEVKPGEPVDVTINATKSSCVCMALVDKSVHLMKPGYFLGVEKIFEEMSTYDMDNIPFEEETSSPQWTFASRSHRKKRSIGDQYTSLTQSRDAKYAFLEAGLIVMTDAISLDHKQRMQVHNEFSRQAFTAGQRRPISNLLNRKLRSFFPETWYWECFTVSSGSSVVSLKSPDTITTWQANAVAMSSETGIGVSQPSTLLAMKKFFISFNMPYAVIRGEQVKLPLTIHNYLDQCVTVRVALSLPTGVVFSEMSKQRAASRILCVAAQSTKTISISVEFLSLGEKYIKAVADAFEGIEGCCNSAKKRIMTRNSALASDGIKRTTIVKAEGDPQEYTHSIFVCPNDRMNITSTGNLEYHFVKFEQNKTKFSFVVKAKSDVHIALSEQPNQSQATYEIVLGGTSNHQSWITYDGNRLVTAATDRLLSDSEFRSFWIKWENGNIEVGRGTEDTHVSRLMQSLGTSPLSVINVGFATANDVVAEFRLWRAKDADSIPMEFFELSLPNHFIPGSQSARATMLGDIMGPTLKNLNKLLKLPFGCGEQNMVNFAPNIYILNYLKETKQVTPEIKATAIQYLQQGYQRQLTYKRSDGSRSDGSYSAFGDRDEYGSMWLTAFVLKSFAEAKRHIYIDSKELHETKEWILSWQKSDGSFPAVGKVLNRDLQGGVNATVALSAYVVIALLECGLEHQNEERAIALGIEYLELNVESLHEPYSTALVAYALTLYNSPYAEYARTKLQEQGLSSGFGSEVDHWSIEREFEEFIDLDPSVSAFSIGDSMKQTVTSANIEMTSFALLAFVAVDDITSALPIVRWLSKRRNELGGFSSTQDTCVALQALSKYATSAYIGGVNLEIEIGSTDMERKFFITKENYNVMQSIDIPELPGRLFFTAEGEGCTLFQTHVQFNTPEPGNEPSFDFEISLKRETTSQTETINKPMVAITACMRWRHKGASNMAVLDVPLLTGLSPDLETLESLLATHPHGNLKRFELKDNHVIFYFDEISHVCKTCITFKAIVEYKAGKVKSQSATVYDYYEPAHRASVFYHPLTQMQFDVDQEAILPDMNSDDIPEGMQCSNSIKGCSSIEPRTFPDIYNECKCYKECGFGGPVVCGSDRVTYMNTCRMEMAACEKDVEITEEAMSFCNESPYVMPAVLPETDIGYLDELEFNETAGDWQYYGDK